MYLHSHKQGTLSKGPANSLGATTVRRGAGCPCPWEPPREVEVIAGQQGGGGKEVPRLGCRMKRKEHLLVQCEHLCWFGRDG